MAEVSSPVFINPANVKEKRSLLAGKVRLRVPDNVFYLILLNFNSFYFLQALSRAVMFQKRLIMNVTG